MKITATQLRRIIKEEAHKVLNESYDGDPDLISLLEKKFGGLLYDMQAKWDEPRLKEAIMNRLDRMVDVALQTLASRK